MMLDRATAKAILAQRQSLAQAVVARQYDRQPELRERYGESGQAKCVQDTEYHLDYLAAALMFSSPVLFREYIGWVKTVLTLRKVRLEDVEENLACLWSVLRERLPDDTTAIQPFIEDSCRVQPKGPSDLPTLLPDDDPLTVSARQYLQALLRADRHEASRLVQEAFTSGVPITDLYLQVFQRCQREVGRLWQLNQLTVAQEHYCTAAAQLIMSQLYSHLFSLPRNGRRLVATTVAGEYHEVGLRIVTDLFEADGWATVYLGANVPAQSLIQTLNHHRPNLLVISVTMAYHLPALGELIDLVRSSNGDPSLKIMVGGHPFNLDAELWKRVGADAYAADANEAIQIATRLVGTPTPSPSEGREKKSCPADVIALSNRQGAPQPGREVSPYDELSRLNSDLLTLQRELVKKNAEMERSITEQTRAEESLAERVRLLALSADVGMALTQGDTTLRQTLQHCAGALVEHLEGAFARIWTLNPEENVLELQASAGLYTHLDGPHSRVPVGKYKIGMIAQERRPHLTNAVQGDNRVPEQEWARREALVAFAGYPLMIEDQLLGVMAMFARHRLSDATLEAMAVVANGIASGIERKKTQQRLLEQQEWLRESEARLRFTLDATQVGQWDLDLVTDTVQRTLRHDQIFGYDSLQPEWRYHFFLNKHCHPDDRALFDQKFKASLATGEPWESECRIIRADQGVRWIWAKGGIYLKDGGKPLRMVGLVMDITERKKIEEEHKQLTADLNRSNTDLEQFAYVASHDLQEPLRAVAGCVQVLQKRYKGNLDARADELIGHTVEGVSRMQTLINDLLTYSRIATRGQEFTNTVFAEAVEQALANLQSSLKESGAIVTHDSLPTVKADRGQITQLFQNLIGNALKYRGQAVPNVHIGVQRHEREWLFSVRDNGIGIKKEFFDRIFILFQRLHTRTQYTGTGIGLAICKKIVERHGGRIWVESEPANGATFFFTIPDREEIHGRT